MDFTTRYAHLNTNQRQAVDHIHGPLLVIAGPGTGKTELLSMRAAQILRQTDTLPSSILCLTFTESGANNMRQRLRQIIGEDAYKIAIHTFHSFGTEIISQHRQYFFRGSDARPIDEITQHEILSGLFEQLDWKHPLSSKNYDEFVYLPEVVRIISEFKQSGLTPDELRSIMADNQRIIARANEALADIFAGRISKQTAERLAPLAQELADMPKGDIPSGISSYAKNLAVSLAEAISEATDQDSTKPITAWKNSWCKKRGDTVQLKDTEATEKLAATIDLYERYNRALDEQKLFDYDDMILSVLSACRHHADLRADLQEQYQFIMVDEFQDTNLAQLRLLFQLTGSDRDANVMAVGDDDQAIFSFQGADVGNIQRFYEQYANPRVITLVDNYRSAKVILDASRQVITQGTDRLEGRLEGLSKQLTAHADTTGATVHVQQFASPEQERDGVAEQIQQLINNGTPAHNITIIARRHRELIDIIPYLQTRGIHVNYERHDDILTQDIVMLIEKIAWLIIALADSELDTANAMLPEIISHPALGFSATSIWQLSLRSYKNRTLWLETMTASSDFQEYAHWLLDMAKQLDHQSLEAHIDQIVQRVHEYFFGADALAHQPDAYLNALTALRTLRNKLRDHYISDQPTLRQLIAFIDLYRSMNARLTSQRPAATTPTNAVNLMTAHKSKGLEFPHVFVIGAIDGAWGEKVRERSRLIRYPANLPLAPAGAQYDERLRLFFVAMTRAKQTLHISFAATDAAGKDTLVASFLSEHTPDIAPSTPDIAQLTAIAQIDWRARIAQPITGDLKELLTPTLERYKLSATHLNNFLDVASGGPQAFLTNNLLRFPSSKSAAAGYGTAIHNTLQYAHTAVRTDAALPPDAALLDYFTEQLHRQQLSPDEFANLNDKGRTSLSAFLDAKRTSFRASQRAELDFASQGVVLHDARLSGKLDLVDIDPVAKTILVTDYKTGKPADSWRGSSDYEKIKLHKYRQQLMFYQLLVTHSRDYNAYQFTGGILQFVEPRQSDGSILALEAQFDTEELSAFAQLVGAVWRKIMTLELPDISGYSADYKGMMAFEQDLLEGVI